MRAEKEGRPLTKCELLYVDWLNSDFKTFDGIMRDMKKLLKRARGKKLTMYFRDGEGLFETEDIGLACYLRFKGVELVRYRIG